MFRPLAFAAAFLAVSALLADGGAAVAQAQKNQMVKGTVKSADVSKSQLVINQTVKNEKVDRELSIRPETEFKVTGADGKVTTASGKDGLILLAGQAGAEVQVKCDKDVNVISVTAKLKK